MFTVNILGANPESTVYERASLLLHGVQPPTEPVHTHWAPARSPCVEPGVLQTGVGPWDAGWPLSALLSLRQEAMPTSPSSTSQPSTDGEQMSGGADLA